MPNRLRPLVRQFLAFGIVGVAGFLVDAGVLLLMLRFTQSGPYFGRVVSFLCAASFTWILNKTFTFRGRGGRHRPLAEWLRFLGANAIGGAVNFSVYSALIAQVALFASAPVAAVAAGSLSGLTVNFALSRTLVFAKHPSGRTTG